MKAEEAWQIYAQRSLVAVRARMDQGTPRPAAISLLRALESQDGSDLGVSDLQPDALVQAATRAAGRGRHLSKVR